MSKSSWKCGTCGLNNKESTDKCIACFTYNPKKYWKCEECNILNYIHTAKCIACFNKKPPILEESDFIIPQQHEIFLDAFIKAVQSIGCKIGEPYTTKTINAIEQDLNIIFPSEFVSFLLMVGSVHSLRRFPFYNFDPLGDMQSVKDQIMDNRYDMCPGHTFKKLIETFYRIDPFDDDKRDDDVYIGGIIPEMVDSAPRMLPLDDCKFIPCLNKPRGWMIDKDQLKYILSESLPFGLNMLVDIIVSHFIFDEPIRPVFDIGLGSTNLYSKSFFGYLIREGRRFPNKVKHQLWKVLNERKFEKDEFQKALPFWSQMLEKDKKESGPQLYDDRDAYDASRVPRYVARR